MKRILSQFKQVLFSTSRIYPLGPFTSLYPFRRSHPDGAYRRRVWLGIHKLPKVLR